MLSDLSQISPGTVLEIAPRVRFIFAEPDYNSGPWKGGRGCPNRTNHLKKTSTSSKSLWKSAGIRETSTRPRALADQVRFHDPVFPSLNLGIPNIKTHIEGCRRAFPDLKFTIDDTIAERNEVVLHWTARGTHKGEFLGMQPTNRKVTVEGTSIYRLEGSKIAEGHANWNLASMMEQPESSRFQKKYEATQGTNQGRKRKRKPDLPFAISANLDGLHIHLGAVRSSERSFQALASPPSCIFHFAKVGTC